MKDATLSHKYCASGTGLGVTGYLPAALQAILAGLAVAFAAGCGVDERGGQTAAGEPTRPDVTVAADVRTPTEARPKRDSAADRGQVAEATSTQPVVAPVREEKIPTAVSPQRDSSSDQRQVPEVTFPPHDAPLGTDNGGNYWAGRLVLDEGCLWVEVPPDVNGPGRKSLLIWPKGFAFAVEDDVVSVMDGNGRRVARVGDYIRLTHATVSYQEAEEQGLLSGISERCNGPFYLVGDEVSVFDPDNEPTELSLSDPEVIFPRQKTVIATGQTHKLAEGVGELVLDGRCLRLGRTDGHGYTIVWPAGFEPHVEQGVVQVRNGAGRVIAHVGDRIAGGGGYTSSGYGDCPGGTFGIHSIKVLPDVEVYFPRQDGTLGTGEGMERFVGKLVVERRCLKVDDAVRVRDHVIMQGGRHLLIWPDAFSLDLDNEVAGIVDATGRTVARVGDEVEFSAVSISYQEAMDHTGLREITPACTGGYWVVGEDFAGVGDGESQ